MPALRLLAARLRRRPRRPGRSAWSDGGRFGMQDSAWTCRSRSDMPLKIDLRATRQMQFRLLGPLQVVGDRAPLTLGQPKQRALLACLLLRRGRFASRDELIEALWGHEPPKSAVGSLHVYVHGL